MNTGAMSCLLVLLLVLANCKLYLSWRELTLAVKLAYALLAYILQTIGNNVFFDWKGGLFILQQMTPIVDMMQVYFYYTIQLFLMNRCYVNTCYQSSCTTYRISYVLITLRFTSALLSLSLNSPFLGGEHTTSLVPWFLCDVQKSTGIFVHMLKYFTKALTQ